MIAARLAARSWMLWTLVAVACRSSAEPPEQVTIAGYREVEATQDGRRAYVFGPDASPRFLALTKDPESLRVVLTSTNGAWRPKLKTHRRGSKWLLASEGVPPSLRFSSVRVEGAREVLGTWTVRWRPAVSSLEQVNEVRAHVAERRADLIDAIATATRADPWRASWIDFELGIAYRRLEEREKADAILCRARDRAETHGLGTLAVHAELQRCRLHIDAADLREARGCGERTRRRAFEDDDVAQLRIDGFLAQVELRTGRYRASRQLYERVRARAWEIGDDTVLAAVLQNLAHLEEVVGRYDAALELLSQSPETAEDLVTAGITNNIAWTQLRAMLDGQLPRDFVSVRRRLERAREIYEAIGDSRGLYNVESNLAYVAFLEGDLDGADLRLSGLERIRASRGDLSAAQWFALLLEARIALGRGRLARTASIAGALSANLDEPLEGPALVYAPEVHALLAEVALAANDPTKAELELEKAADLERRRTRHMSLESDRSGFDLERRTIDLLVDVRMRLKKAPAAAAAIDALKRRLMQDLEAPLRVERLPPEAYADWVRALSEYGRASSSGDAAAATERFEHAMSLLGRHALDPAELRAPTMVLREDEAVLDVLETRRGWWGVLYRRGQPPHVLSTSDPALAFRDALVGVEHLYFVPDLRAPMSLGALDALVPSVSIIPYASWLDRRSMEASGPPLVVTSSRRTLPGAFEEGAWLSTKLERARWMHADATRSSVLEALDGPSLFHFAGHGVLRASSPWKAHLSLAGNERITLEDLLLHPPRVRMAVLNGCSTGDEASGTVVIPHAFLLAGADAVLATDRPVEDWEARRFIETFYEAGGIERPGRALRIAAALAAERGDSIHLRFRLFGRPELR